MHGSGGSYSVPGARAVRDALYANAQGDVVVAIHFDATANAIDAAAQQSAFVDRTGRRRSVAAMLDVFERASVASGRHWRVDPAAMPADSRVPDGFVGYVHFAYRISTAPADVEPGEWRLQFRTVERVPTTVPVVKGVPPPGVADLAEGEMGFTNSRFRLAQPLSAAGS